MHARLYSNGALRHGAALLRRTRKNTPMIEVTNLTYAYPRAANPAIRGISFSIRPGEIFGFLGPSGAGKSTTQKILIGLLKGYQGRVQLMGKELREWSRDYYGQIGVGFELPNHYQKLTALENLNYFRALYTGPTTDPRELLALVGLADDADTPVAQFSKGMQMRLNLVRALINQPRLVYLDEPTAGLDPLNSQRVRELIRERRAAGTTFFLTTHDMAVAEELCDRVAFIIDGAIRLIDAPRTLKIQHGERKVRVEYHVNSHTEAAEFALDNLGANAQFVDLLRSYPIETIHTQETTLERIFIDVTGRSLQ